MELIKQCRKTSLPLVAVWASSILAVLLLGAMTVALFSRGELLTPLGSLLIPVFGFLSLFMNAITRQQKRDAALVELIKQEAPELHAKLQDEGVV